MHLEVTFRNLRPRSEIRRRAEALYGKLERFLDPAATATLVVTLEHQKYQADLVVTSLGQVHQVVDEDADLRTSLDRAFHRVETALRRAKEKRVDLRHQGPEKPEGFAAETA